MKYLIIIVVLQGMIFFGCTADSVDEDTRECAPNTTQECVCPGGTGAQTCSSDGSRWEECVCLDAQGDSVTDTLPDNSEDTTEVGLDISETEEDSVEEPEEETTEDLIDDNTEEEPDSEEEEPIEPTCTDLDGDLHPGHGDGCDPESDDYDCDEDRNDVYRGAEELCDGVDNDCDEEVDENLSDCCIYSDDDSLSRECYTGPEVTEDVGLCHSGLQECLEDNTWGSCSNQVTPDDEVCDGEDNDCDGEVDEDFQCCGGEEQSCYTCDPETRNVGECQEGIQSCQDNGTWGSCEGERCPVDEVCDGLDNNCEGEPDEELVDCCIYSENNNPARFCYAGPEGTEDVGLCRSGMQECLEGNRWGACSLQIIPETEVCDGEDNNCDGDIDEDFPDQGHVCSIGTGECVSNGEYICQNGNVVCDAEEIEPSEESCDGLDNDCDGQVDNKEDGSPLNEECYSGPENTAGVGLCQSGTKMCESGEWGLCTVEVLPSEETCSNMGSDDDCDGDSEDVEVNECPEEHSCCAGECINLENDNDHCGTCNMVCSESEECIEGLCSCGLGFCGPDESCSEDFCCSDRNLGWQMESLSMVLNHSVEIQ